MVDNILILLKILKVEKIISQVFGLLLMENWMSR